jgi:hypothetical protein
MTIILSVADKNVEAMSRALAAAGAPLKLLQKI